MTHILTEAPEVKTLNILDALKLAVDTLMRHDIPIPEGIDMEVFKDPAFGDWFNWSEDGEYAATDIEGVAELIDMEDGQVTEMNRSISLPPIWVACIGDEFHVFDTEKEADDAMAAAE